MIVTTEELKKMCAQLLSHLENNGYASVSIPVDYYWNIPAQYRYDPYREPEERDLGQLTDDWAELQKILNDEREPIGYALVWLSTILRVVGEQVLG